jgi:predicted alpha/beta-hydrolase family hydrolase
VEQLIETSLGPARITVTAAAEQRAVLWVGHGAGGGIGARDLTLLASALPTRGITVIRHEQPWRVAGKRVAARPATLDLGWLESAPAVVRWSRESPLIVGGRSAGARVACRTAQQVGALAVVCLAFPLHPPGTPGRSRLGELLLPDLPVLVVQGEQDTFGAAAALEAEVAGRKDIRVVAVPGADHGMKTAAKSDVDVAGIICTAVADFFDRMVTPG